MLGLVIAFALLGLGFAVGYLTRTAVSRRRRAVYLAYAPYLEGHPLKQATKLVIPEATKLEVPEATKSSTAPRLHLVEAGVLESDEKPIAG